MRGAGEELESNMRSVKLVRGAWQLVTLPRVRRWSRRQAETVTAVNGACLQPARAPSSAVPSSLDLQAGRGSSGATDDEGGRAPASDHAAAQSHEHYMGLALLEASKAAALGEVPVGAVLVSEAGEVLAGAHNAVESLGDPTAHAELLCLRRGAAVLGSWRLQGTTLYVTLEPCPMCAGALLQARVAGVVYGARNHLLGADGSWIAMLPREEQVQGAAAVRQPRAPAGARQEQERVIRGTQHASSSALPSQHMRPSLPPTEGPEQGLPGSGSGAVCFNGTSTGGALLERGGSLGGGANSSGCSTACGCGSLGGGMTCGDDTALDSNAVADGGAKLRGGSWALAGEPEPAPVGVPRHPFHPTLRVVRGVLEAECAAAMRTFFKARRGKAKDGSSNDEGGQ